MENKYANSIWVTISASKEVRMTYTAEPVQIVLNTGVGNEWNLKWGKTWYQVAVVHLKVLFCISLIMCEKFFRTIGLVARII